MKLSLAAFLLAVDSSNAANLRSTNRAKRSLIHDFIADSFHDARACTLFQMSTILDNDKIEIKDDSVIHGEVCVGVEGELKIDDKSFVDGKVYKEGMVKFDPDEETIRTNLSKGVMEKVLGNWKVGIESTSGALANHCDSTEKDYKPEDGAEITVKGDRVICYTGDVEFKDGDFTIKGDGTLVINIMKKLLFDKATVKAGGNMSSANIIFNVVGDDDVKFQGDCEDGVCTTEVDGTIIAANKVEISESTLNGWVFAKGEVVVKQNAVLVSDPSRIPQEATPSPSPEPTSEFWQKEAAPPSENLYKNSFPNLGIVGCSILQASSGIQNGSVQIRDKNAAVYGDVCVGSKGKLEMDDDDDVEEFIYGAARLENGAIIYDELDDIERRTKYLVEQDDTSVAPKIVEAASKSTTFEEACVGENVDILSEWKSETPTIHVEGDKRKVICVDGDVEFKDRLFTVTGTGTLIMNIAKKLVIDDATIKVSDSSMVLFNMMSTHDDDVTVKAGSVVDGSILGMNRKIEVSESRINGQIISARDIKIKYGSMVVGNNDDDDIPDDDGFPERTDAPTPSPEEDAIPEIDEPEPPLDDTNPTTGEINIVEEIPPICHHIGTWVPKAAFCTVFQMSDSADHGKLEVSGGDSGAINGNACVGTNGELKVSSDHEITNTVYLGTDVKYDLEEIENSARALAIPQDSSLADARLAAIITSDTLESKCEGFAMKDWKSESSTISVSGERVLCIEEDMEFKDGDFTITGEGTLIVNVGKRLKFDKATVKVYGRMKSNDVIFNVFGNDGAELSDSELDGTILSPRGKVDLDRSYVNGQVLSIEDILIKNESLVSC